MRVAPAITLTEEERAVLVKWARGRSAEARRVERAKIVLAAADGAENRAIAAELGCTRRTVGTWRRRFAESRIAGIERDAPRSGRSASVRSAHEAEILRKTTQETPPDATQWSLRSLAEATGVSRSTIARIWHDHGLQPHRTKSFKVSNDKRFAEKLVDVVGLYLDPPENALVLSCDEKSQIQALDRSQKSLPLYPGRLKTLTHDYRRHGTTTLFAALEVTEGKIISKCLPKHRHQEWIEFLKQIDAETPPELQLHLIVDNYATHKHEKVVKWLKRHKRFHLHFIPTSSSWLNVVERWFRDLTQKRIRNGVFRSVAELVRAIDDYTARHNARPKPFVWTKKADDLLEKITRARKALDKLPSA